jgi:hypothetical protein
MKQVVLTILCVLFVASATADVSPSATLALIPDTTLPGTPVAFLITITNPANQPKTIANGATLRVTGVEGSFEASVGGRTVLSLPDEQLDQCSGAACLVVPALGERQIYIDIGPMLGSNPFFIDRRLSNPGKYGLQLQMFLPVSEGNVTVVQTNVASLTIQQPTGVNLSVWQFLRQISTGNGWGTEDWIMAGDAVGDGIRTKFPTSDYVVWVGTMGRVIDREATVKQFDQALAMNPPSSLRDDLLWVKAKFLDQWSRDALQAERNQDQALSLAGRARDTYTALQRLAISDLMRKRATEGLPHLYTRQTAEETLRMLEQSDSPAPASVIPRVECVSHGTGNTFSARFGYANPNKTIKVLSLGDRNEVTPAPRDQGQPRVFKPGDHTNVFTATSPGGNLIWHLDRGTAVATADFPTQCAAKVSGLAKP